MNDSIACIVVVGPRWDLVRKEILPNILDQSFDEVLVVGNGEPGRGYRYLPVHPLTDSTLDGLIKRDAAAVATRSETLVYLCDDHRLHHRFGFALRDVVERDWDVLTPRRYTVRDSLSIPLAMGVEEGYCAGHGIVIRRSALRRVPWTSCPWHRNWDVIHSRMLVAAGCKIEEGPSQLILEDIEWMVNPESKPWT